MSKWKRPYFGIFEIDKRKDVKHSDGTLQKGMPIPLCNPEKRRSKTNITKGVFGNAKEFPHGTGFNSKVSRTRKRKFKDQKRKQALQVGK